MARVALSVAIVNAYITQGQIVGPTQVVSNGTDVATAGTTAQTDMATLSADIATAVATATTVKAEAIALATIANTTSTDVTNANGSVVTYQADVTATVTGDINNYGNRGDLWVDDPSEQPELQRFHTPIEWHAGFQCDPDSNPAAEFHRQL